MSTTSARSHKDIFISSSISCLLTNIITNPMEVAKLKVQYAPVLCPQYPHSCLREMSRCSCARITPKQMFKGLWVNLPQSFISTVSYMHLYQKFRNYAISYTQSTLAVTFSAALLARIIVTSILVPVEAFRVRLTNSRSGNQIVSESNGFKVTLIRDAIYSCLLWFTLEKVRNSVVGGEYRYNKHSKSSRQVLYENVIPSAIAGSLISALTTPIDNLKTRIQSGIKCEGSLWKELGKILRREGYLGLFSGVQYRVARNTIGTTIYVTSYQYLLKSMQQPE